MAQLFKLVGCLIFRVAGEGDEGAEGAEDGAELVGLEDALEGVEGALLDDPLGEEGVAREVLDRGGGVHGDLVVVEADHGDDAAEAGAVAELDELAVDGVAAAEVGDDLHGEDLVLERLERGLHDAVERLQRAVAHDAQGVLLVEREAGQALEGLELLLQGIVPRVFRHELQNAAP